MSEQILNLPTYQLNTATLPQKGHKVKLEASKKELKALALACDVEKVSSFSADTEIKHWHKDGIIVQGTLTVAYVQNCVVTTEPIYQTADFEFSSKFVPEHSKIGRVDQNADREIFVSLEGDDVPEPLESDVVNIWEIVLEFFLLEINPFPRLEGVNLEDMTNPQPDEAENSPFAVLKTLKHPKT